MTNVNESRAESFAAQVARLTEAFNVDVGPTIAAVFASEQAGLIAAGLPDRVVKVGDTVSDALLLSQSDVPITLATALDNRPGVLVFYRGAWCPYCNLTLAHYQRELYRPLLSRNVGMLAISPQRPDGSSEIARNGNLEFPVLSDVGNVLTWELGILTKPSPEAIAAHKTLGFAVADSNADATAAVPFPTVLVVDTQRVVRFVDVQVDYTRRTEVWDILAAVDRLS